MVFSKAGLVGGLLVVRSRTLNKDDEDNCLDRLVKHITGACRDEVLLLNYYVIR